MLFSFGFLFEPHALLTAFSILLDFIAGFKMSLDNVNNITVLPLCLKLSGLLGIVFVRS